MVVFENLARCIGGAKLITILNQHERRQEYIDKLETQFPDFTITEQMPDAEREWWFLLNAAIRHGREADDPLINIFADLTSAVRGKELTDLIQASDVKDYKKKYKELKREIPKKFPGLTLEQATEQEFEPTEPAEAESSLQTETLLNSGGMEVTVTSAPGQTAESGLTTSRDNALTKEPNKDKHKTSFPSIALVYIAQRGV